MYKRNFGIMIFLQKITTNCIRLKKNENRKQENTFSLYLDISAQIIVLINSLDQSYISSLKQLALKIYIYRINLQSFFFLNREFTFYHALHARIENGIKLQFKTKLYFFSLIETLQEKNLIEKQANLALEYKISFLIVKLNPSIKRNPSFCVTLTLTLQKQENHLLFRNFDLRE